MSRQDQSRTEILMFVLLGLMWLIVGGLGINTVVKAYEVAALGTSLSVLNDALASFIIAVCLTMLGHIMKVQAELMSA